MKPENEIIAHNIKLLRNLKGLTQPDFGLALGSNQKNIWAYEQGNVSPKSEFILQLSKFSGVMPDTLLNIKLKLNKAGEITNLPSLDKDYNKFHKELELLVETNRRQTIEFHNNVNALFVKMGKHFANINR